MTPFDELQTLWREGADAPPPAPEDVRALRSEAAAFDRAIRWRDWRETAAAAVVAVAFGSMYPEAPPLARLGVVLSIVGAVFAIGWMVRAQRRQPRPAPDLPAAEALRVALARVEIQIHLLRSVVWWYLLPLAIGPMVLVASGYVEMQREMRAPETAAEIAFVIGVYLAPLLILGSVFGVIYKLNQRAVRRDLLPLRDRLAALLHTLSDPD